ncbi:divalent-cation tolerance protein CutA [Vibrio fluvialis]|uniref:divalent-cation tolerance protein CutA n=1 Tax=Vibrio fluvialis TaxID=676 RepID=UPI00192AE520|nr:divalent-cation tolerance protein CutA [Vibrio fluvialis]MBL4239570.1 divalent-cation tolerance protein CutA [Vibrio fluvialis]MBL4263486.1 divalent-cation tolerance protein CutA [Vibrio fluvialis]MBL4267582.1 divalent-cation tolerance protein CutA [Vibrio fluvialis]MBL4272828.1 divalent-cation tolerance protein CutA [Vibrio fluvialis]MBO1440319.1 divalent-cation tolerance protein CutA [Vibrio fluvialis]
MDNHDFCIVLTTTNRQENAQQITHSLLSKQLAACMQSMPIQSHYLWNGEVCCDSEILLIIKTRKACYAELEQEIEQLHCYEVPQIVQVPIVDGFNPYLAWIEQNTPR